MTRSLRLGLILALVIIFNPMNIALTSAPAQIRTGALAPVYSCDGLYEYKPDGSGVRRFSIAYTAKNSAELTLITYDFGDGNIEDFSPRNLEVRHPYAVTGTYFVTVTLSIRVEGVIKKVSSRSCTGTTKVEVHFI